MYNYENGAQERTYKFYERRDKPLNLLEALGVLAGLVVIATMVVSLLELKYIL